MSPPRLLYCGDVAVENSTGGEAVLHRFFSECDPAHLLIVEASAAGPAHPDLRLPGYRYQRLATGSPRPLSTRFGDAYAAFLCRRAPAHAPKLDPLIADFRPTAVLSVVHNFAWITAAAAARKHNLPLHLIYHDDWHVKRPVPRSQRAYTERLFADVYRQAATRWCVSPRMAQVYSDKYAAPADVLYPHRAPDAPVFTAPPPHLSDPAAPLVVGYAGSIHYPEYAEAIVAVARLLAPLGGRCLVTCTMSPEKKARLGLGLPNITVRDFLPPGHIIPSLHRECSALIVPSGFSAADRTFNELSFPSKLTDYTAAALPLLVTGPEYASAVVWARDNPGTSAVATSLAPDLLGPVVTRLATDPAHRVQLAHAAVRVGMKYFSDDGAVARFRTLVTGGRPLRHPGGTP